MNIEELNSLASDEAIKTLSDCCASESWVEGVVDTRPFSSLDDLKNKADEVWFSLSKEDWLQAFSGHPKIGDVDSLKKKYASTKELAQGEQSGVDSASTVVIEELAACNKEYEDRFGYIFIVCATGKSADEMLAILKTRLPNEAEEELQIAAKEQSKITKIRLEKLL